MEGEVIEVYMPRVHVQGTPQIIAQKRKIQVVAGTEDDAVEVLGAPVHESHSLAVHRLDPRFDEDTSFCHQRQKKLTHCDTGLEDVVRWLGRAKLLRTARDRKHELFEAGTHRGHG